MNTINSIGSQIFRGSTNTNSVSYVNRQNVNVTLDPSGTDYVDYSNNAIYFHDAHGININNENTTSLVVNKTSSPFFLSSLDEFTFFMKYKVHDVPKSSILGQFYTNPNYSIIIPNPSPNVGDTFTITILNGYNANLTYTISGDLTSADLNNADMSGTLTTIENHLTYTLKSGYGQFLFLLDNTDISASFNVLKTYFVIVQANIIGETVFAFSESGETGPYYNQPDLSFGAGDQVLFNVSQMDGSYSLVFGTTVDDAASIQTEYFSQNGDIIFLSIPTDYSGNSLKYFEYTSAGMGYKAIESGADTLYTTNLELHIDASQYNYTDGQTLNITDASINDISPAANTLDSVGGDLLFTNVSNRKAIEFRPNAQSDGYDRLVYNVPGGTFPNAFTSFVVYEAETNSNPILYSRTNGNEPFHCNNSNTIQIRDYSGGWTNQTVEGNTSGTIAIQTITYNPNLFQYTLGIDGETFNGSVNPSSTNSFEGSDYNDAVQSKFYIGDRMNYQGEGYRFFNGKIFEFLIFSEANMDNDTKISIQTYLSKKWITQNLVLPAETHTVTVSGEVFYIDGSANPQLTFTSGYTYIFDLSHNSNAGNTFVLGTVPDSSTNLIDYQTIVGTPGQPGAYTTFTASGETVYYYSFETPDMGYEPPTYIVKTETNVLGNKVFSIQKPGESVFYIQPDLSFGAGFIGQFNVSQIDGSYSLVFGTTVDDVASVQTQYYSKTGDIIFLSIPADYSGDSLKYFENTTAGMGYYETSGSGVLSATEYTNTTALTPVIGDTISRTDTNASNVTLTLSDNTNYPFANGDYTISLSSRYINANQISLTAVLDEDPPTEGGAFNEYMYWEFRWTSYGTDRTPDNDCPTTTASNNNHYVGEYIQLEMPYKTTLNTTRIMNRTTNSAYKPDEFVLLGKNSGSSVFDYIGTKTGVNDLFTGSLTGTVFTFNSNTPYNTYRIVVTKAYQYVQMGIWSITGYPLLPIIPQHHTVTVSGEVFYIDGSANPQLTFTSGEIYVFDQSDTTNAGNTLVLGTVPDSSTNLIDYQTVVGTPGQPGAYTTFTASGETVYYYSFETPDMGYEPPTYKVKTEINVLGDTVFSIQKPGETVFYTQPDLSFGAGFVGQFDVSQLGESYSLVFGTEVDVSSTIQTQYYSQTGDVILLSIPADYSGNSLKYFENTSAGMGYYMYDVSVETSFTTVSTTSNPYNITCSSNGQYVYSKSGSNILKSIDYGLTYNAINTPISGNGIITSEDGQNICIWDGSNFATSTDYGNTFSSVNTSDQSISVISVTGQYICRLENRKLHVSNDYGSTFTELTSGNGLPHFGNPQASIYNIKMSTSGQYIMISANEFKGVIVSDNYGASFSLKPVTDGGSDDNYGRTIFMSPNGRCAIHLGGGDSRYNPYIYTNDYGFTWYPINQLPFTPTEYDVVYFSYDGTHIYYIDTSDSNKLYYSNDSGLTYSHTPDTRFSNLFSLCADNNGNIHSSVNGANEIKRLYSSIPPYIYNVTVSSESFVFYLSETPRPNISFNSGTTYIFDLSHNSNTGNTLVLGTVPDSSTNLIDYQTVVGTPGQPGAYTSFTASGETVYYYSFETPDMGYEPPTYTVKTEINVLGDEVFSIKKPSESVYYTQPDLSFGAGFVGQFDVSQIDGSYSLVFGTTVDDAASVQTQYYSKTGGVIILSIPADYSGDSLKYFENTSAGMGYVHISTSTSNERSVINYKFDSNGSNSGTYGSSYDMILSSDIINTNSENVKFGNGALYINSSSPSYSKNNTTTVFDSAPTNWCISLWMKTNTHINTNHRIFQILVDGNGPYHNMTIGFNSNTNFLLFLYDNNGTAGDFSLHNLPDSISPFDNTYHHYFFKCENQTFTAYIDDINIGSITFQRTIPGKRLYDFTLGDNRTNNTPNTYFDDVKIFDKIVTIEEAKQNTTTNSVFYVEVSNNVFYIDGSATPNLTFTSGDTYIFDLSHNSNAGNTLVLGTVSDSSVNLIDYQTIVGTPGQPGAYTSFTASGETVYYYSFETPGMGYFTLYLATNYNITSGMTLSGVSGSVNNRSWTQTGGSDSFTDGTYNVSYPTSGYNGSNSENLFNNNNDLAFYAQGYYNYGNANTSGTNAVTTASSQNYYGSYVQITLPYKLLLKQIDIVGQVISGIDIRPRTPYMVYLFGSNDGGTNFTYLGVEYFPYPSTSNANATSITIATITEGYYTIRMVINKTQRQTGISDPNNYGHTATALSQWQLIGDVLHL